MQTHEKWKDELHCNSQKWEHATWLKQRDSHQLNNSAKTGVSSPVTGTDKKGTKLEAWKTYANGSLLAPSIRGDPSKRIYPSEVSWPTLGNERQTNLTFNDPTKHVLRSAGKLLVRSPWPRICMPRDNPGPQTWPQAHPNYLTRPRNTALTDERL